MSSTENTVCPPVPPAAAQDTSKQTSTQAAGEKPLRICCACPETRQIRDQCVVRFGEENCGEAIENHKICLRKLGFDV